MASAPSFWRRRGAAAIALLPLAGLFGALSALRRRLYRHALLESVHVGVPVVVVGNLVAGGGGKTPLVVALVQALQARGFRPGVIARGYGGAARDAIRVATDSDPRLVGDEPLLIRQRTGAAVVVGRDRVDAARRLLAAHPGVDVIVSDDGLQHYRLRRALELCVIGDGGPGQTGSGLAGLGLAGLGNGWLLPAGPLRETRSRLLRVDAVVYAGVAPEVPVPCWRVERRLGQAWRLVDPEQRVPLDTLAGRRWLAAAGIARPEGFFAALEAAGLDVERRAFPDHHAFAPNDLPADAAVLMTEKDAVKCRPFAGRDWWAVELDARVEPGLFDWLVERLRT